VTKAIVSVSAVGAESGLTRVYRYRNTNYGRPTLLADHGYGSTEVPLTNLDSALDKFGLGKARVLVLKIDVEGYEPAVIVGAARTLTRTDAVVLEYSADLGNVAAMIERLAAAGFTPHRFGDGCDVVPIPVGELRAVEGQMDVIWLR
jgi:hypothetical protein